MSILRILLLVVAITMVPGCGEPKTEIPTTDLTDEQKAAIKAEDAKVADEESHGAKKR